MHFKFLGTFLIQFNSGGSSCCYPKLRSNLIIEFPLKAIYHMIDLKLVIQSIKSISPSTMSTGYLGLNSETLKFQVNFPKCKSYICLVFFLILLLRGSGVLPKGQLSWNISLMKEARVDPKIVLELSMECPSRGIFFCP